MMKMRKFIWMLVFATATVVLSGGMVKNSNVAMAEEANYYDAELINVTKSYNMGENANMTGGTAGTIFPGEKLRIIRKDTSSNKYGYCYYVYAINAGIYGYVSPSYVKVYNACVYIENKQDTEQNYTDTEQRYDAKLINVSKSYSLGLNANMTGGTAGTVYPGEKFQVIRKDTSNNKYGYCYYVYAINAGIYGYVSPTYIELVTEKLEYIPYDLANHLISVTSASGDTTNSLGKHNWVSNECSICGCTRTEKATYSKTNDLYHKVSIEYTYPIDGGKTKKNTTEEHTFENGKCVKCGRKQASNEKGLYVTSNKVTVYKGTNSLTGRAKTLKKGAEVTITEVVNNAYNNLWGKLSDGSGYVWMANLEKKETKAETIQRRLDEILSIYLTRYEEICRERGEEPIKGIYGYATVDGLACQWDKCDECKSEKIVNDWFREAFGIPKEYFVDKEDSDKWNSWTTKNTYSCCSFMNLLVDLLFAPDNNFKEPVPINKSETSKQRRFNEDFIRLLQPGDAIYLGYNRGKYSHFAIVYDVDLENETLTVVHANVHSNENVSRDSGTKKYGKCAIFKETFKFSDIKQDKIRSLYFNQNAEFRRFYEVTD
ncbi:MAG: hypothetical protein PUC30_11700 [Lachnospiraceae bacterium]|nr:hypothetical protein [Lachnospiraceae bacterium]